MYDTLMVSDTLYPYGRTRPGRTSKKPNDLSTCESEECDHGRVRYREGGCDDFIKQKKKSESQGEKC